MTDYINTKIKGLKYGYLMNDSSSDKIISTLYSYLVEADEYISRKITDKCFNYTLSKIHSLKQIPKPNMGGSYFFPKHIQQYIDDNATYNLQFTCKIKNRDITIHFVITSELSPEEVILLHKYVHMMYMWLYILDEYSSKQCSKSVSVFIYFTPFEKQLPNNQLIVLDTEHVNTAYTTGCKESTEIVLYRSEEWFKVFIHETFHNFGLDFSSMNLQIVNKKMYTYQAIKLNQTLSVGAFKNSFKENMEKECLHSLFQAMKILHFMDLKYKLITEKTDENIGICNYLYKEKTSVFSYYIITSLLINNYIDFMGWCSKNNNILLQFKQTPGNLESYIEFIYKCCTNSNIKKNISAIEKMFTSDGYIMSRNLRMTSVELKDVVSK